MNTWVKALIASAASLVLAAHATTPVEAFACGKCGACIGGHTNPFGNGESEGIHSGCVAVAGCPHPDCVATLREGASDFESVLVKAENGDLTSPKILLRKYPGTVFWNKERHALQLKAPCSGEGFIGHIPLTAEQTRVLAGE